MVLPDRRAVSVRTDHDRRQDPECLADGQVLLRFSAAGVCGSDLPAFRGARGRLPGDDGRSGPEKDGFPIHEVAGEVIASRHPAHRPETASSAGHPDSTA